jgi:hypothetical protein
MSANTPPRRRGAEHAFEKVEVACRMLRQIRENLDQFLPTTFLPLAAGGAESLRRLNVELAEVLLRLTRALPGLDRLVASMDESDESASLVGSVRDAVANVKAALPVNVAALRGLRDRATGHEPSARGRFGDAARWQALRAAVAPSVPSIEALDGACSALHRGQVARVKSRAAEPAAFKDPTIWKRDGGLRKQALSVLKAYEDGRFLTQEEVADKLSKERDYVARMTPALAEAGFLVAPARGGGGYRRTPEGTREVERA